MAFLFKHGDPLMVDYTNGSTAVTAGDVVIFLGKACIAHTDIEANALGAVSWPNGRCVYELDAPVYQSGADFTAGLAIDCDANGSVHEDSDYKLGTIDTSYEPASETPDGPVRFIHHHD